MWGVIVTDCRAGTETPNVKDGIVDKFSWVNTLVKYLLSVSALSLSIRAVDPSGH